MRAIVIAALVLGGCAHQVGRYPDQPAMVAPVNQGIESVNLRIVWHDSVDSVNDACGKMVRSGLWTTYGCARLEMRGGLHCTINAMPPKDFNDVPMLAILGHEVTHCWLAQH